MNMKALAFSCKQMFRPHCQHLYHELSESQFWPVEQLREFNWRRRMELLETAYRFSDFHRKRFDQIGLQPGDIKDETDFAKIPVMRRQDVRLHIDEILTRNAEPEKIAKSTTGGSTGIPLEFWLLRNSRYDYFTRRYLDWWKVGIAENSAYLYRNIPRGWHKTFNQLKWWPTQRAFLDAAQMSDEANRKFLLQVEHIRPALIVGYVGAIAEFADFLEKTGNAMPSSVKAVWTTAAPLPGYLRQRLTEIFHAEIYSQYGSREFGHIATECMAHTGMHINWEYRHVEIVDTQGKCIPDGTVGDILVTDMQNTIFPFIRYELGDRGQMLPPERQT